MAALPPISAVHRSQGVAWPVGNHGIKDNTVRDCTVQLRFRCNLLIPTSLADCHHGIAVYRGFARNYHVWVHMYRPACGGTINVNL